MNWKAEAVEKLRRYDTMRQAVQNIPEELAQLELAARSIRGAATDRVAVKSSTGREDALLNNLALRQELCWSLERAKHWIAAVDRALGVLIPEERLILSRLYIYPEKRNLDRLCSELEMEQSTVYRRRDRALRKFTLALYGETEQTLCGTK